MSKDLKIGIKFLWSWDRRFWSWFTSHGVESAYTGGRSEIAGPNGLIRMIEAPDRVFDQIYHLGPLKVKIGIIK